MRHRVTILALLLLTACGGGGGGGSSAPAVPALPDVAAGNNQASTDADPDGCETDGALQRCVLTHDGLTRRYLLYVPDSYTGDRVPLLLNFHGYGSNADAQLVYADFRTLAEEAPFILVVPQGTLLDGTSHWAVGSWTIESTTDDVDFVLSLIDTLTLELSIDLDRVYATGMSNGGYMSYHLACQLSDRIAAIASVTGSMSPEVAEACSPSHPTAVLQIHGTDDGTVPYGGADWTRSMAEVVDYWAGFNGCGAQPTDIEFDDVDGDGNAPLLSRFDNCADGVEVQLYTMNGMGHVWPEQSRNEDIEGTGVVWSFLRRYGINGVLQTP